MISEKLTRGKVDFSLTTENTSSASSTSINADVVKSYIQQIKDVSQQNGISQPQDWWIVLSRMNDITSTTEQENVDEEEWVAVKKAIIEALDQLVLFRTQEGEALAKKFKEKNTLSRQFVLEKEPIAAQADADFEIVKTKHFNISPMSPEEAILQMNLLGHNFFMFFNSDTEAMAVVYRRDDGKYGLIDAEK